jgi:protein kinase A
MDTNPTVLTQVTPLRVSLSDVKPLKPIASGTFGVVKLCKHIRTSQYIAMKQLNKSEVIRNKQVDHLKNEISILASIAHPGIVQFFGFAQNERHFNIFMEMVSGGELFHFLREKGRLDFQESIFYSGQIVLMFEYLHSKCVVYRDLKPENLLIGDDGYLKLTDFGFAKVVPPGHKTYTLCGTPEYIAPEILANKGHDKGVDWWTLGVILFEFLEGVDPFTADSPVEIYKNILGLKLTFSSSIVSQGKSLIKKLLQIDVTKRLGCLKEASNDIKNHPFYAYLKWDMLSKKMIVPMYSPTVR